MLTDEQKQECYAEVLGMLNSAFNADPLAMHCLTSNRVPCNEALMNHPQAVVLHENAVSPSAGSISALGLLNGAMLALGLPLVAGQWKEVDDERHSRVLVGYCEQQMPRQ